MPRRRCPLPGAAALAGSLLFLFLPTRFATAQEPGEPIVLEYHASPGCPDEAAFARRIRARTSRARIAWPAEPARTFTVSATPGPPPRGEVTVTNEHGTEGTRALQAGTCAEVVDGLALIVALAVDPHARTEVAPAPSPAAPAPAPAVAPPAPLAAPPPPPSLPPAVVPAAPAPSPAAAPAVASPSRPGAAPPFSHRLFVGADLVLAGGIAPGLLAAASPYLGVRALHTALFDLALRASFVRTESGPTPVANGAADFTWTVGRLDGCALFHASRSFSAGPCARVEAGALDVLGSSAGPLERAQDTPWLAAGALARLEWTPLGALLVEGDVGATGRIVQDSFYFAPDPASLTRVPAVGFEAALGLGALFP